MSHRTKSSLMTPDPYHTPGYLGYVPQFKYRIGNTFGHMTHEILSDKAVPRSGNPVLGDTQAAAPPPSKTMGDFHRRSRSWGTQKYVAPMVPGYTGYIPQQLNHYGARYAEICHSAVSSFEQGQDKQKESEAEFRTLSRLQSDPSARPHETLAQNTTPLKPVADRAKPYLLSYSKQHSISPFYMPDGHPQKYFMAGYTGFVPTARKHFGQSYPIITTTALHEHKAQSDRLSKSWNEPVSVFRQEERKAQMSTIYPKDSGFVPRYTGHIPGEKFKFGSPFGSSTRDAAPRVSV